MSIRSSPVRSARRITAATYSALCAIRPGRVGWLQQVGDAALARLAVDPDDRVVAAAQAGRLDRQVRDARLHLAFRPTLGGGPRPVLGQALPDGVLVGAAERSVHEVAGVFRTLRRRFLACQGRLRRPGRRVLAAGLGARPVS
jgi:hypothetical protein